MIYKQNDKPWTYPDHNADPKIKASVGWCANALQFYVHRGGQGSGSTGTIMASQSMLMNNLANNRRYARGAQGIQQYLPMLGHTQEQIQQNKTHMAIDWSIPQIWPKFRDIMLSKMSAVDYKCSATLVDPVSLNKRIQAKYELELQIRLRDVLERWNQMAGANITGLAEGTPRDMDELDISFEMNYKEAAALAAEKGIDLTLYANDWREIRKKMEEDSIDCDIIACRTYVDSSNALRIKYIDPLTMLLPGASDREFKHLPIGYVERLTLAEIKKLDQFGQITELEWQGIFSEAKTRKGQIGAAAPLVNNYIESRGWVGDHEAMDVVYMEWPSLDVIKATEREDRHGNKRHYIEEHEQKKFNKTYQVPMWYGCYWIVGTETYFGYGPSRFQNRLKSQLNDPRSSIHVYSNSWDGTNTNSLTSRARPFINAFTIAWYKFQDEVNRARPSGFWIDINAINNIVDSQGESLHPKDNIAAFLRSGVLLVSTVDEGGTATRTPVQELPGSLQNVKPHIETMMLHIQNIRDVTGLNEFVDGSTPTKELSATATNYLAGASDNALYRCLDAVNWNYLNLCRGIVSRLQILLQEKDIEGYVHSMGQSSVEAIKLTADLSLADIGLVLENINTPQEKMWVERQIELAMQQRQSSGVGGITLDDALAIRQCRTVKMAERMLSIRLRRRQREDAKRADDLSRKQAEYSAQAGQAVEAAKQQTLQLEVSLYMQKEEFMTQQLKARLAYQMMWQNEIQDTKNEGAIAAAKVRQGLPPEYTGKPDPQDPSQSMAQPMMQ